MRIENIANQFNVETVKKLEKERQATPAAKSAKDRSTISSDGKRLSETSASAATAQTVAELQPDVRSEKVQEVRDKIKSGFYNSEAFVEQLAEKLMKDFGIK